MQIKTVLHKCNHVQEHVMSDLEMIGDRIGILEQVPCVDCCKRELAAAEYELARLETRETEDEKAWREYTQASR